MNIFDRSGNAKRRPPLCAVSKQMAEAGKLKLTTLVGLEEDAGVTDDQIVAEVFAVMWAIYWEQVFALQGKKLTPPHNIVLPPGMVRN